MPESSLSERCLDILSSMDGKGLIVQASVKSAIYVAIGGNLTIAALPDLRSTLEAGVRALGAAGLFVAARSSWWQSPAWPPPVAGEIAQPDYLNAMVRIDTILSPRDLLARLHTIEQDFGRVRRGRWDARPLDLDLIDYAGQVSPGDATGEPVLPHPRATGRLFVLLPLQEIAPDWHDPASGRSIATLIEAADPIKINKLS